MGQAKRRGTFEERRQQALSLRQTAPSPPVKRLNTLVGTHVTPVMAALLSLMGGRRKLL